jgi:flagellar biosynthesis protein FlhB
MSDTNDAASKTEEPTPRKLEQAREKGDFVKTQDLGTFASLAAVAGVIAISGGWLANNMANGLTPFLSRPHDMIVEGAGGVEILRYAVMAAVPALAAILGAAAFSGAAGHLLQTGLHFTPEKLKPDLKKVSPVQGFKRIFGPDGLAQFVKTLCKVLLTAAIGWWVLQPYMGKLTVLSALEPAAMMPLALDILKRLVFSVAGLTLVIAGADWLWQRQRFMTRMRMTREELKEDYKQSEGDPHVRARQKQIRNERARRRMMASVPEATVVIMNPTHYAVALKYEQGEHAAPLCVAKGLDTLALKIREIAEAAGVPVVEDPPLARALYAAVDIDEMIPTAHYEAVAKVIGFILGAANRRRAAAKPL